MRTLNFFTCKLAPSITIERSLGTKNGFQINVQLIFLCQNHLKIFVTKMGPSPIGFGTCPLTPLETADGWLLRVIGEKRVIWMMVMRRVAKRHG